MNPADHARSSANQTESEGSTTDAPGTGSRDFLGLAAAHDARHARELAVAYLQAAARDEPANGLAIALAAAVAAAPELRLALAVLAGGPSAHARAIELAGIVLGMPAAARPAKRDGKVAT